MVGAWTGRTETETVEWGWWREVRSWFQRQGEAYLKERSVVRSEDDVGDRARMTRDEERVLWGGWTGEMCRWSCHSCAGRCESCGNDVVNLSEACQAMSRLYHNNCFTCCVCRTFTLAHTQTHSHTDTRTHTIFLVHGQVTIIFVMSVGYSVCLCRVFLSRLWSDFDQTRIYVICLGLVVSRRI